MRYGFLLALLGLMFHLPVTGIGAEEVGPERFLQLQEKVQSLLPKVRPAVVAILTGDGTASGVIMNPDGLVLTAAHVAERPGRELRVVLEDGEVVKATTLGLDKTTDAALMQMNDTDRKWPHIHFSRKTIEAQPGEWCFALGHPGGFDEERGVVLRVGRIIKQTANSLQTDCVLMGGDSGGPLFNLKGEVIGIHSLIWEGRDENMHVSMAPFLRSWNAMKSSVVIRTWSIGSGGYLGLATEMNALGALEVVEVIANSPSEKAGVKMGDIILALNGEAMTDLPQFTHAVRVKPAGEEVQLRLRHPDGERDVKIKLGTRPTF
jgi:serine protease Do